MMEQQSLWTALEHTLPEFSRKLEDALSEIGIGQHVANMSIDHICVRFAEPSHLGQLKKELGTIGTVISTEEVGGREVSIIELNEPIELAHWSISAIEIPYPKQNHAYEDGWQHVEFVLSGAENTPEGIENAFSEHFPHIEKANLVEKFHYKIDTPQASNDQIPNPTIELVASNNVEIKFHANPIQKVVGYSNKIFKTG